MIKKKFLVGIAGVAAAVVISGTAIAGSYSSFISTDAKNNSFKTGTIDIENNENAFKNVTSWDG